MTTQQMEIDMGLPKQQHTSTINDCIVEHMYIVEQEARKIIRRGIIHHEYNDLYQLGMIGLIEAAHRFDHRFQCSFSVYAPPSVWPCLC